MSQQQAEALGREIVSLQPRQISGLPLLYPVMEALSIRQIVNRVVPSQAKIDLGRIVEILILNRLLSPVALYGVSDWLAESVLPDLLEVESDQVYDNRLGRALDQLHPKLGEVWAAIVSRAIQSYDLDLSILHWDITSIYFEGAYADSALARYGYSRDHRTDTKQVNVQVDTTDDGQVPILYQVLPGNTADITRPLDHLEALLAFLARPELADSAVKPILVSDCKMITPEAVLACHFHDLYYLGPVADSEATRTIIESVPGKLLAKHPLRYRPKRVKPDDPDFQPYQGVWRPFSVEHGGVDVTDRALVVWSAGKERLDIKKRKNHLKRLLDDLANIQKRLNVRHYKRRTYVEQRLKTAQQRSHWAKGLVEIELTGDDEEMSLHFAINRQRLAAAQALDGRYLLATNAKHLDAHQTLTIYKGQDGIEKRFRTVKGPLLVHPLFVHSDERIEGMVFISLLALLVRALLEQRCRQRGITESVDRLLRKFESLQAIDIRWQDGSSQRQATQMSDFQAHVLRCLGWRMPHAYAHLAQR
jgi:transposase